MRGLREAYLDFVGFPCPALCVCGAAKGFCYTQDYLHRYIRHKAAQIHLLCFFSMSDLKGNRHMFVNRKLDVVTLEVDSLERLASEK